MPFHHRPILTIVAPESGRYTFYCGTDDGVRLWINGTNHIDDWYVHGTVWHVRQVELTAGQSLDLRIEYFEDHGGANAKFEWRTPSGERDLVRPSGPGEETASSPGFRRP